jgi:hypothetical protein
MRYKLITILSSIALFTACSKDQRVRSLDFDATAEVSTLNTGDTAKFYFTGEPDFISFYSGEPGHRYAYRDRISAAGKPVMSFTSARANGKQENSLQLMISTDFTGVNTADTAATLAAIAAGNWTDITARATLSTGTVTSSGDIDLSDYKGNPVYIAFRHNGYIGSTYSKWTITQFQVTNNLPDSTSYIIANMAASNTEILNYGVSTYSPGFAAVTVNGPYRWVVSAGTSLLITGATSAAAAKDSSQNWAIVGPIDLQKVTPDQGMPIKMIAENMEKFPYIYQYMTPGKYQATFVASNVNADNEAIKVKTLDISVNER